MRRLIAVAALVAAASGAVAGDAPPGALSCSGCHGARADEAAGLPKITGRPADEIVASLAAFRSGERPATVMNRISKGFTPDEDRALAAWLAGQP